MRSLTQRSPVTPCLLLPHLSSQSHHLLTLHTVLTLHLSLPHTSTPSQGHHHHQCPLHSHLRHHQRRNFRTMTRYCFFSHVLLCICFTVFAPSHVFVCVCFLYFSPVFVFDFVYFFPLMFFALALFSSLVL